MSSDCFQVRIKEIDGVTVTFELLTGLAGGFTSISTSRSLILLLLDDALRRAPLEVSEGLEEAERRAERERLSARMEASPLYPVLRAADAAERGWYTSEPWMRENLDRFVRSCTLVERRNLLSDAELLRRDQEIEAQFGGVLYTREAHRWMPLRWERCHNFTLRAALADPAWAAHLEVGLEYGSTAFDVWEEG